MKEDVENAAVEFTNYAARSIAGFLIYWPILIPKSKNK